MPKNDLKYCNILELENPGKDCWNNCGRKGGECAWCGTKGRCCRGGHSEGVIEVRNHKVLWECDGRIGGHNRHICTSKSCYKYGYNINNRYNVGRYTRGSRWRIAFNAVRILMPHTSPITMMAEMVKKRSGMREGVTGEGGVTRGGVHAKIQRQLWKRT